MTSDFTDEITVEIIRIDAADHELELERAEEWFWSESDPVTSADGNGERIEA